MPDLYAMMQMQNMSDATKCYLQVMVDMHTPLTQGGLAQDADVAFNCSMIVHHEGAIGMARVELKCGKDVAVK